MPSAGWYEDPNNELAQRYFDGEAWTRQTRTLPPPTGPTTPDSRTEHAKFGFNQPHSWSGVVGSLPWLESAKWIVAEIHAQSVRLGAPMDEDDVTALFTSITEPVITPIQAKRLNNYCVPLIRSACEHAKTDQGVESVKVHRWLRLPPTWIAHYQTLIDSPDADILLHGCLLYTSPSPRDRQKSRMPSSA